MDCFAEIWIRLENGLFCGNLDPALAVLVRLYYFLGSSTFVLLVVHLYYCNIS
jgi:hypothetical protein